MRKEIEEFAKLVKKSNRIAFFGGAGVSTASGIPDFRSSRGLYSEKYKNLSPEDIVSHGFFIENTELFYDYYREHLIYKDAKPNDAHNVLAILEKLGKVSGIITQNIDGLHQMAGSKKVYEIHGNVHNNRCMKCGKFYNLDKILGDEKVPRCECGGIIKPEVVLYGENLSYETVEDSIRCLQDSDLLIIAGTSLSVYPAASYINFFKGDTVLINLTPTFADNQATLVIHDKVEKVMREMFEELKNIK